MDFCGFDSFGCGLMYHLFLFCFVFFLVEGIFGLYVVLRFYGEVD